MKWHPSDIRYCRLEWHIIQNLESQIQKKVQTVDVLGPYGVSKGGILMVDAFAFDNKDKEWCNFFTHKTPQNDVF